MSNFEFISNPIMPGQQTQPQYINNQMMMQQQYYPQQQMQQMAPNLAAMRPVVQPEPIAVPKDDSLITGGYGFSVLTEENKDKNVLTLPMEVSDTQTPKRRGGRRKKDGEVGEVNPAEIVRAENTSIVEDTPTIYSYMQTTGLLQETLQQIDMVAGEIKEELDAARLNRTLKNKHNYIVGLSANLSGLLGTKIQVIREINSAISKSNEMDYKKEKDRRASEGSQNDDKYLMDMYTSFIRNPMGESNMLAPNSIDSAVSSIGGTGIVRSPLQQAHQDGITDIGYLNYLNRLTPEQNMMFYEQNPNVKTVVVFDVATGNKFFQVMDMSTGQVIPNVPVMDNRFMEDTYIDVKNKVATNNNLHESYPVVLINEGVTNEY